MKAISRLSAYQLYAISSNHKLAKDIRQAAGVELRARALSLEEHNAVAEKYRSLSGGGSRAENKTGAKFVLITLCFLLPPMVFLSSGIVLCAWSCLFAACNKPQLKMRYRTLVLYTATGFLLWTIILMIAGKYFL